MGSSFQINTNIGALEAYNALNKANNEGMKAQLRLATRKRINSVADDVSGYNVGKSLDSKVQLMKSAQGNIGAAKNMLSTAESALQQVKDKLTQIRSYVADATDPTKDRKALAQNIQSLGEEIKNIFNTAKFNDRKILMGTTAMASFGTAGITDTTAMASVSASFTFQTGADANDRITLDFAAELASTGTNASTVTDHAVVDDIYNAISSFTDFSSWGTTSTQEDYATAIGNLASFTSTSLSDTSAIGKFESRVSDALGKIGNFQQRLDVKDEYLTSAISNAQASVSRLFDADMAMEQLNATKAQIGSQVATSMLSQLNSAPQNVLQLFR
ncbi:MAG: flagellar biosynthesis protein FliC [Ignavibacteria bacterium]|jgi:flagellin|nr:flagellar biosynthesis protein FliC [Ignavibacteria bacterium]MCU7518460.1 flagellar biosynthesis protein FliC [Ignavibacteria bacterium]